MRARYKQEQEGKSRKQEKEKEQEQEQEARPVVQQESLRLGICPGLQQEDQGATKDEVERSGEKGGLGRRSKRIRSSTTK